jgi:phosphogluconate dehydratase
MCLEDPDIINARLSSPQPNEGERGCGRELFAVNRDNISNAEQGASYLFPGV